MSPSSEILDAARSKPHAGGPSFTRGHQFQRALWNLAWLFLASWTPPPLRAWRRVLLRAFGAKVAPTANIYGSARIWHPPNLQIGDYACIGRQVTVYCMAKITFDSHALASQGAHLCAGTHDVDGEHFQLMARPIHIGRHAWIAAEAFIGPGVTVGDGAVLGARGCAFRDLEPWTIYVGNPARPTRPRRFRPAGHDVVPNAQ